MIITIKKEKSNGLKIIRLKTYDNTRERRILRSIFFSLLEIAYDNNSEKFTSTFREISEYSGLSQKTLKRYTIILIEYGLIDIGVKNNSKKQIQNIISINTIREELRFMKKVKLENQINQLILQNQNTNLEEIKIF